MYIDQIKEMGYALIKKAVDPLMVSNLLETVKSLYETTPAPGGNVPYLNQGHKMIYNLQNKSGLFITSVLRHPEVKGILAHFLNDKWYKNVNPNYILRSMIARSGGPEPLPLHIDSFIPSSGEYTWSLQVMFVLEGMSEENGCTVVAPGSHLYDKYAVQEAFTVPVIAQAGDILIWDSRLWHGATGNKTDKTRWALISTFTRWWIKQNFQITKTFPYKINLTKEELAVIGYTCEPPRDEYERMEIKSGYELCV